MKVIAFNNSRNKFKSLVSLFLGLLISLSFHSCKKLVEVSTPTTKFSSDNVYSSDATATSVLTGIYETMSTGGFATGINSISLKAGLSADEFSLYPNADNALIQHYKNSLISSNETFWYDLYKNIYLANSAIEGLTRSKEVSESVKNQLLGEAKFIRAFCNFYLVHFYGDVPLVLTTDYRVNSLAKRNSSVEVIQQIITDLKEAQGLLTSDYVGSDGLSNSDERVRPNKWAATALLARVYLYNADWANAETQSSSVINNTGLYDTVSISSSISNVFEKNSKEAIWQLMPVNTGENTADARVFILTSSGPSNSRPVYLSTSLLNAFELNDKRKNNWVDSIVSGGKTYYFPYKYKISEINQPVTEYLMVLRLAEQYLIRAEARAQLNKIAQGQTDLNVIRKRAGLPDTNANDAPSLVAAILHERQVELFSEWGHRWLDLKRTGNLNSIMTSVTPSKGGSWNSDWQLYPIPLPDLQTDPNLTQNPGY